MKDRVEYKRSNEIPGLVLSEARFSDFRFERHYHLDYHVALVTEGVQRQGFHGETLLLTPGTIQLMPPGEVHDGNSAGDESYTLKTFRVSPQLLSGITEEITGQDRFPALGGTVLQDARLAGHLSRLHDALRAAQEAEPMEVQSEWLMLLDRLFSQTRMVKPHFIKGTLTSVQWQRVRDYCDVHLAEKITLEELAALCALERFHFLKLFKQTVGMTPHAWLVRLRLERACALLSHPDACLTQVAQEVGFYDQSHFNRAFRQAFGVSPSKY
ncbi:MULTISPECIES: AraC family transcriptional regulator [Paraburkholderia]|uniref:helix-turn-helix transcriptional regulator n=1 Tax=Paraburkholderia TaxID=1822464 RepID=UPI002255B36C|nr:MULTISPECIES: AraC family transcriptional regulator [Paraburkholderia]MCX4164389.1 AraC family transcriptional regulator [Paraburkholderia megapolitana]MDN7159882.1 AraC family transcriptional regulator [Paraburkholderia sp. CHISQ3]MDQ6496929.1 AraC family transcriptional regulator [Paraburkholderia megapolitana]